MINNFINAKLLIVKSKTSLNGFCYRFMITKKSDAISFLKTCIPFLFLKQKQAKILLNFCEKYESVKCRRNGISSDELCI